MIVAILADEEIKAEIIDKGFHDAVEILWADSLQSLRIIEADAYFDLLFENDRERIARLKFLLPKQVFCEFSCAYMPGYFGGFFQDKCLAHHDQQENNRSGGPGKQDAKKSKTDF